MADNVILDAGSGGATIKTDDDGTAHWQYVKVSFGADNTQTIVDSSTGLPVLLLAGTAEIGKLAAGVAEIGNVKNSGTFATQATATNAGTFVVQEDGAALTALQVIDNIVHVDDAAYTLGTSSGVMMMGFAGTQSVNANDAGAISMETDGSIHIHDGGNSITVDGTVTANPASGTIDTVSTVTNLSQMNGAAITMGNGASGTGVQRVTIASDTTGVLSVDDNGGSITVDNGGTFATQSTLQAGTAEIGKLAAGVAEIGNVKNSGTFATQNTAQASTNTQEMVGDVAHDAAAAGNPVLIGSRATAGVEALTEVAEADASYIATDLQGVVITRPYIAAQEHVQYHVVNTAGTELAVTGLDAGGAGVHNYVTSVIVHNAHASTNGFIQLLDGSGGTAMATFPAPATGGAVINFTQPIKQTTANTALYWDASAAITTLYVTIVGYQGQG